MPWPPATPHVCRVGWVSPGHGMLRVIIQAPSAWHSFRMPSRQIAWPARYDAPRNWHRVGCATPPGCWASAPDTVARPSRSPANRCRIGFPMIPSLPSQDPNSRAEPLGANSEPTTPPPSSSPRTMTRWPASRIGYENPKIVIALLGDEARPRRNRQRRVSPARLHDRPRRPRGSLAGRRLRRAISSMIGGGDARESHVMTEHG